LYYAEEYAQDKDKSILDGNMYDLTRFSEHESETILSVFENVEKKYPPAHRAMGLVNESYPVIYKPRYVLFETAVIRHKDSKDPLDRMAVALAYEEKGAFFRKKAIEYFESSSFVLDGEDIKLFHSYPPFVIFVKFSKVYESEHLYEKAAFCMYRAAALYPKNAAHFSSEGKRIREKMKNPPKKRNIKMKDDRLLFERRTEVAAVHFDTLFREKRQER